MRKLGTVDLEIIHLGVRKGGAFDEKDIEASSLNGMGVGRILDALASLRDRDMITQGKDGSFSVTDAARGILWDHATPLWTRMLRLLQTRSCTIQEMAEFLLEPQDVIMQEAESMRKKGQVMITPQRRDGRLLRVYEILDDGKSRVDRGDAIQEILVQMERGILDGAGREEMLRLLHSLRESL
ncbi:MAG: hypothetical protein EB830_01540 [Nitrosopumilus sp. H13]|nr:MAG: hypothetical protein EB830_01540 [Nitrosopumilus sp. H13]